MATVRLAVLREQVHTAITVLADEIDSMSLNSDSLAGAVDLHTKLQATRDWLACQKEVTQEQVLSVRALLREVYQWV